jgi:hypothetical protein
MGEEKREKFCHKHSLEKHKEIGVHIYPTFTVLIFQLVCNQTQIGT